MTIGVGLLPVRNDRNGAQAAKWVNAQPYNVEKAARDMSTPEHVLADIAANATGRIIGFVCSNKGATADVIRVVANNKPTFEMMKKLVVNPNTPSDVLESIYDDQFFGVSLGEKISRHPNLTLPLVMRMLDYVVMSSWSVSDRRLRGVSFLSDDSLWKRGELFRLLNFPGVGADVFLKAIPFLHNRKEIVEYFLANQQKVVDCMNREQGTSLVPGYDFASYFAIYRVARKYYA